MANPPRSRSPRILPLLHRGVLILAPGPESPALPDITVSGPGVPPGTKTTTTAAGATGRVLLDPMPRGDVTVRAGDETRSFRIGGCAGAVTHAAGGEITGWARDTRRPDADLVVVALDENDVVATAVARPAEDGCFTMILPASVSRAPRRSHLLLGIEGTDCLLEGGRIAVGQDSLQPTPALLPRPISKNGPVIGIKISTPNLKEAPLWGDYHFANSLAASFERLGLQARVDTADAWYGHAANEDIVLAIRGRHRLKLDPGKVNVMWLISHPDRIPNEEYADYDHVAVASDVYAATLRVAGLAEASVLHQATDAGMFGSVGLPAEGGTAHQRKPASLFVGNSRREYRTMVKWCIQQDIPLELYGGGWDGILPPGTVRAGSIANADLPACYADHLLLLNDHWDSMRDNGFLSNRLFDGSATGTPILTDPVAGLADVFGDTIATADSAEDFAGQVRDCLSRPDIWLERAERARRIVLDNHTFDHRAATLAGLFQRLATIKLG